MFFFSSYLYNPGIMSIMPVAGGCLTRKKNVAVPGCLSIMLWLFLLIFFTFCYFLIAHNFCKLLFIIERGKVCYFLLLFFTACNFDKLFFIMLGGAGFILYSLCDGGKVHLDFSIFFFYC